MTTLPIYRQGDVAVCPIDTIPAGLKALVPNAPGTKYVLQAGTATGHQHVVSSNGIYAFAEVEKETTVLDALTAGAAVYLQVTMPTVLSHEEHAPIELPVGLYEVKRQREYAPEAPTWVND